MENLTFDMQSFSPTQGQWFDDHRNQNVQRRGFLFSSHMGYHLWVAEFRTTENLNVWPPESKFICRKYFVTEPKKTTPIALFESGADMHRWIKENPAI